MPYWTGTVRSGELRLTLPARPGPAAPGAKSAPKARPLRASLSVNRPVFREGDTSGLQIDFTLVNATDQVINPKVGSSKIVINDKALADSGFILSNGPRPANAEALPPGERLRFGYALGDYFARPGTYRVRWEGEGFRSPEITFRVLPKEVK
jgi:hypothetical protein